MNPGIQSLWIILTVMVPGLVFFGTFRLLIGVLGLKIAFLTGIESSQTMSICILFSIMFTLQFFGIVTESLAFKFGPYRHKDASYQKAFDKRYQLIATMDPQKDYHVERILGQFFMSHNIAIGMIINLLWTTIYLAMNIARIDFTAVAIVILLLVITILAIYVPCNRFDQSCRALHAHIHKLN